jgi:hypothetical protein
MPLRGFDNVYIYLYMLFKAQRTGNTAQIQIMCYI